jgi:hypothetical protein
MHHIVRNAALPAIRQLQPVVCIDHYTISVPTVASSKAEINVGAEALQSLISYFLSPIFCAEGALPASRITAYGNH